MTSGILALRRRKRSSRHPRPRAVDQRSERAASEDFLQPRVLHTSGPPKSLGCDITTSTADCSGKKIPFLIVLTPERRGMAAASIREAIMRATKCLVRAAALAALIGALPNHACADDVGPAARLSAALGGDLGDGMSNAGVIGHGSMNSTVEPAPGRSEVYRRRVATTSMLQTSVRTQRVGADSSRTTGT